MSAGESFPRPLGPYLLLARVGRGGMGDVYLARHGMLLGFEKHCVLKMLRDDRAGDDALLARFADEARVVVQLTHRNICPVFDVGRVGQRLYVALEHVIGRDLRTVAVAGPVPVAIALHVVGEVLEALDYAHHFVDVTSGAPLGIVHRDVSPHNVLLGVDGDTKLIDFGIATTRSHAQNEGDQVLGKLSYMSPEHACGEVVDGRSDQFAAAIMLSELLLGARFHEGLSQRQMWEGAGTGSHRPERWTTIEPALRAHLDRALAVDATGRFATCGDFGEALSTWARAHGQVAGPRDVRRHLRATFGDLAAEHRALLRLVDVALPGGDPAARVVVGPGGDPAEGQFESIATTLALPHTPPFGSVVPADRASQWPQTVVLAPRVATTTTIVPALKSRAPIGVAGVVVGVAVALLVQRLVTHERSAEVDVDVVAALPPAAPILASLPVDAGHADDLLPAGLDLPVQLAELQPTTAGGRKKAPEATTTTTTTTAPPPPRPPRASHDADTRSDLAYLQRECVDKVPCAKGIIEWSRAARLKSADRVQLKEAAKDCAKRCRLR